MGCWPSAPEQPENDNSGDECHHDTSGTNVNPLDHQPSQSPNGQAGPSQAPTQETMSFRHYEFLEIVEATQGYSRQSILACSGGLNPIPIYRGLLPSGQQIAIKRVHTEDWPDVKLFKEEAIKAARLRHRRLASLIGYCCHGEELFLVAQFMSEDSLAERLFKAKNTTMEWSMRLRVACYIGEALEYCCNEGQALYHDLTPYKVLFDEAGNPCLSCFGLVKNRRDDGYFSTDVCYYSPDIISSGKTTRESMIFNFGLVLHNLLSGEHISLEQNIELIQGKKIPIVLDPRLKGKFPAEEVTALKDLASQCLRYKHNDRPTIEDVVAILAQIQSNAAGPSNAMQGTGAR